MTQFSRAVVKFIIICLPFVPLAWTFEEVHSSRSDIEIPVKELKQVGLLNPGFRYDNNERATGNSSGSLWRQAGVYLLEWPGNITVRDSRLPLVRWGGGRARYLQSPCEAERGMELAVYAYKYVHLTWGANRLTRSYCQPLRVPRDQLPKSEEGKTGVTEILVVDFDFVFDALLLVTAEGYMVRVGGIELTYARVPTRVRRNLTYSLPQGLETRVSRVVSQKCCSKSKGLCSHGDAVLAYEEFSSNFRIFISYDGGNNFKPLNLRPSVPTGDAVLQGILFYPNYRRIFAFYGSDSRVSIEIFSSSNGSFFSNPLNLTTKGYVQAERIRNEATILVWDNCNVWYGTAGPLRNEVKLSPATFYIHASLRNKQNESHLISPTHCSLGRDTRIAFGEHKIGLLDKNNHFIYGVDKKSDNFQLIAMTTDMSLVFTDHLASICPAFDRNNRPKFVYPPRYLRLPREDLRGERYEERLAMRILKKTLFPSDFMLPFFKEKLGTAVLKPHLALRPCQSSYLSVDGSISQKPKAITLGLSQPLYFEIVFQSGVNSTNQLRFTPQDVQLFVQLRMSLMQATRMSEKRYWFKYEIRMTLREDYNDYMSNGDTFLLTFHTEGGLRCVHQPSVHVWVTLDGEYKRKLSPSRRSDRVQSFPTRANTATCTSTESEAKEIANCNADVDTLTQGTCIIRPHQDGHYLGSK